MQTTSPSNPASHPFPTYFDSLAPSTHPTPTRTLRRQRSSNAMAIDKPASAVAEHVMLAASEHERRGTTMASHFTIFFSSRSGPDGQMWCGDCRVVEKAVAGTFNLEEADVV